MAGVWAAIDPPTASGPTLPESTSHDAGPAGSTAASSGVDDVDSGVVGSAARAAQARATTDAANRKFVDRFMPLQGRVPAEDPQGKPAPPRRRVYD
jgi:hypothetical protein